MSGQTHKQGSFLFGNLLSFIILGTFNMSMAPALGKVAALYVFIMILTLMISSILYKGKKPFYRKRKFNRYRKFSNYLSTRYVLILTVFAVVVFNKLILLYYLVILSGALLGSLMPDIDTLNSTISHKLKPLALLVSLLNWIFYGLVTIITNILNSKVMLFIFRRRKRFLTVAQINKAQKMLGHRGLFHSLFIIVVQIAIYIPFIRIIDIAFVNWLNLFFAGYIFGYLSHLFFDMLTVQGVALFLPFTTKRFSLARFTTNSKADHVLTTSLGVSNLFMMVLFFIFT